MHEGKAAIELYPVTGKKAIAATQAAGFSIPPVPACWCRVTTGPASAMP